MIRENKEKEISNYDYYYFPKSTWTYMHGIWELHVHVHAYSNHVKARESDGNPDRAKQHKAHYILSTGKQPHIS